MAALFKIDGLTDWQGSNMTKWKVLNGVRRGWSAFVHGSWRRSIALALVLLSLLTACSLPRVSAEDRIFLDLSLEFLDAYELPQTTFQDMPVGGLSAIAYDRYRDRLYAVSDQVSDRAPARFYTFKLGLDTQDEATVGLGGVAVEAVTVLKNEAEQPYPQNTLTPAGIAVSPQQSVFISSRHLDAEGVAPLVGEFDLATGMLRQRLPIPNRYLADPEAEQPRGVQPDFAFDALTLSSPNVGPVRIEPFRVFAATELPLVQDQAPSTTTTSDRLLHYLIGDGPVVLISEHLYPAEPASDGVANHLTELLTLDQAGHFLSLETTLNQDAAQARIFQLATGPATDTSGMLALPEDTSGIVPIQKQPLLDLGQLPVPVGALAGMALGPHLPDGSQSLLMVSNNKLAADQPTQILLFRLGTPA